MNGNYSGNQGENMQQNNTEDRPNIWYRPVTQNDYKRVAELGEVTTTIRILPGFKDQQIYDPLVEKDVSRSRFPNSPKWMVPILVINDALRPENNGFVGVYEFPKTVHKCITSKTPPNYFDLNQGYNFNIVVSLVQSKDGTQWFPSYGKSGFDTTPSQIDAKYVYDRLTNFRLADFAAFANRLNNPRTDNNYGGQSQQFVQQESVSQPQTYNPGQPTQPVQNQFVPQQNVPSNGSVQQQPTQGSMPWDTPAPSESANVAPPAPQAPAQGSDDFEAIFGA